MDANYKVTTEQQESNYADIFGGDTAVVIPLFQRSYRWEPKNLDLLLRDVCEVRDGERDSYFLGIVVSVQHTMQLGRPGAHEIVDGQQRLTSLYLLLLAAASLHCDEGRFENAAELIQTYLLRRRFQSSPVNTKLVPSFADRPQFAWIWEQVLSRELMSCEIMQANPALPPPASPRNKGPLAKQFKHAKKQLGALTDGDEVRLNQLVTIIALRLSFVGIALRDGSSASVIFERLNNRAEPVTGADLLRNEVFTRGAGDPETAHQVFERDWNPFQEQFSDDHGKGLENILFPYALTKNPAIKKSSAFGQLRLYWDRLTPREIIRDIDQYSGTFKSLEYGQEAALPPTLNERLRRLHGVGKPRSIYPFVFLIVGAYQRNELSESDAAEVLNVVESFLFRRAICGIEPTGLHAVFKSLYQECLNSPRDVLAQAVQQAIRSKPTVKWPGDSEFDEQIRLGQLDKRAVARFAIMEYERSLPEAMVALQDLEHVCPKEHQTVPQWARAFGGECNPVILGSWANLLPLSEAMNRGLQNAPYEEKCIRYRNSSYASAREVARDFQTWDASDVARRAAKIAEWAKRRWPY